MHIPVTVFAVLISMAFGIRSTASDRRLPTITVVIPPETRIEAELAYNDADRSRGLMYREKLATDAGMLFLFRDLEIHGFWMKNTLIPLDILWLNEQKEVVYFVTAQPCKRNPCESIVPLQKARYVLEINAGLAGKYGIRPGTKLEFIVPAEIEKLLK